jgi:hypothetical protein
MAGGAGESFPPPVLIVGPPRSGTTLLYQLLVQQFDVGYLSNAHTALFGAPVLLEWLIPRALRLPPNHQESRFGVSPGLWAPSEAASFWYRFFPLKPHAIEPEDFPIRQRKGLRDAVAAISRAAHAPLLMKNVVCSVRMLAISSAIPEMRYIVVHRDHVATAESILAARQAVNGNVDAWWSVEPNDIDDIRHLPPEMQVIKQIRSVEGAIGTARRALQQESFADIDYDDLLRAPADQLGRIAVELALEPRRGAAPLPPAFQPRQRVGIDPGLANRVRTVLRS